MQLLLMRHAIAEDRLEFSRTGRADYYRPLTERGRRRMSRGAAGLRSVIPRIDVLATSPLTRAVQTAEIVARAYGDLEIERVESLGSGDVEAFANWMRGHSPGDVIAAVGHEPHISDWTGWFLTGGWDGPAIVKKGSALLLELPDGPRPGSASLCWFLAPAQLRSMGGADEG